MKSIFDKQHMKFTRKNGSILIVKKDGVSYEDAKIVTKILIFHSMKFHI